MERIIFILAIVLLFFTTESVQAGIIFFEGFEDSSGFTIGGGGAAYWGIAPISGTPSIPSYFVQGGSQSGNIFYGSFAKEYQDAPPATMTISIPDLTGYTDLLLSVSLAAPDGTRWESSHRDSLVISGTTGVIDSFLPISRGSPLRSQVWSIDLHYEFQDFKYLIENDLTSLTFAFASTDYDEVIGIDSVSITGQVVPVPSAIILCSIGLGLTGWKLRRRGTF
jgi:hypothetical protein